MELRQLRYFIGASEAGSLLKASARLHVAQPALSAQIAALECEVGSQLFKRSSRGVTLTESGQLFLEHAKLVLVDVERARSAVRESDGVPRGEVAIGLTSTMALATLIPIVSACRTRFPEIKLKVVEAYSGFIREWLQRGRLDLALLYTDAPEPGTIERSLLEDELVLVSRADGPAPHKNLGLAALAGRPLVLPSQDHSLRRIIDAACAPLNIQLNVVVEIESLGNVKRAVETGIGETILPRGAVAEEVAAARLRAVVLTNPALTRRVVCVTSDVRPVTLAKQAVSRLVREVIHGMVSSGVWSARWIDTLD